MLVFFLFRVATEESTEAPNEETTPVSPGKTINNLHVAWDGVENIFNLKLSVVIFVLSFFLSVMKWTD